MMDFVHSVSARLRRRQWQATPREVLCTILFLLVATSYIRDSLAGASNSWWMRFGVLPVYTYFSSMLFPTILLTNVYIIVYDHPLTRSTLLCNTRLTWRHMASAIFYQNLARQGYHLVLQALGAASAVLPSWLWWLDAIEKPTRLFIHIFLLRQEMVWTVCLVFLAIAILDTVSQGQQLPVAGFWLMSPCMNFAEAIVREDMATGFFTTCCFAGISALYHGAVVGMLPALLCHFLTGAGTMVVICIYTKFTLRNFVKHYQHLPPASLPITAVEGHSQMH